MDNTILTTLSYRMYAIGIKGENEPSACIVNMVIQATNTNPSVITASMHHDNYSHECIREIGIFSVSVLSEDTPGTVIGALGSNSGRNSSRLKSIRHHVLAEGVPVIKENACCWFLCKVVSRVETSTRTVFLAEMIADSEKVIGTPMTYTYYHQALKGSAPKNTSTYRPAAESNTGSDDGEFICKIRGYIYNDPDVLFEDLPEDWLCPVCAAPKSAFIRK